jgi:hypothetical protein
MSEFVDHIEVVEKELEKMKKDGHIDDPAVFVTYEDTERAFEKLKSAVYQRLSRKGK